MNWFPEDDSRRNLEENTRVMAPLAEAIATRTTVDIPRIVAPGTPSWFACDVTSAGAQGVDPAAVFATLVDVPDVELEVEEEVLASFGFTECTVRSTTRNFPNVRVQVQDSSAQLQDSLDSYLDGWPEAELGTVAGFDVAIRVDESFDEGILFTVVGDSAVEIRVNGPSFTDMRTSLLAAAELVLTAAS